MFQKIVYYARVFFYSPPFLTFCLKISAILSILYFILKVSIKNIFNSINDNKDEIKKIWNLTEISLHMYKEYIKQVLYLKYINRNKIIDENKINNIVSRFCKIKKKVIS